MSINNIEIRRYGRIVESRDVDFKKRATVMALGDYFLHAAGMDADLNGFGVRTLNETCNSSWVLTRFAFEIYRMPEEHDRLLITTWVSDINRLMTTRNFEIFDSTEHRIAAAISNWAMIDISTRRPADLHTLGLYGSMVQPWDPPIDMPQRLASVETESPTAQAAPLAWGHTVQYSDLDFNGHANSMKYLQWVVDTLPIEILKSGSFRRIDMNFIHESLHGEQLTIIARRKEYPSPDAPESLPETLTRKISETSARHSSQPETPEYASHAAPSVHEGYLYEIRNSDTRPICRIALQME